MLEQFRWLIVGMGAYVWLLGLFVLIAYAHRASAKERARWAIPFHVSVMAGSYLLLVGVLVLLVLGIVVSTAWAFSLILGGLATGAFGLTVMIAHLFRR